MVLIYLYGNKQATVILILVLASNVTKSSAIANEKVKYLKNYDLLPSLGCEAWQ